MMVAPERDVPGIIDKACANPTQIASRRLNLVDGGDSRGSLPALDPQNDNSADDERHRDRHRGE